MPTETDLLILELPVLEDEAVATLQDFLWDLVTQIESHYFHQLRRHQQKIDARDRDLHRPRLRIPRSPLQPSANRDDDLDDDIDF